MLENIWVLAALIMMVFFLMLASVFHYRKEKACSLISGYNFKSKEERKKYDEKRMSLDMRNFLVICSGFYFLGAITAFIWGAIGFWMSFGIWFLYFLRNFHINHEKAFGKYRK